ncbi:glycoside hydrolase family 18 [Fusarium longipes]|uniref:Glycoside hydrolase family 18 n=1 Tax=Fusarium longipes TaxID=694270 RepID=A0A395T3X4_9HYPO|nr:glycoside hydrolase family 18 [Fusarium longipes]
MDEWPYLYLLSETSDTFKQSGVDRTSQRMRWLKDDYNTGARQWRGVCFGPTLDGMTIDDFYKLVKNGKEGPKAPCYEFDEPAFIGNKLRDAGLWDNGCGPKKATKADPGFVLLSYEK